jgi:hypothetical protein
METKTTDRIVACLLLCSVSLASSAVATPQFPASMTLPDFPSSGGVTFEAGPFGIETGTSVCSAGDLDDDGIADFVIGAPTGKATLHEEGLCYVVFGGSSLTASTPFDLGQLDGTNGFLIVGGQDQLRAGVDLAAAGDVNGDGVDDLLIGSAGLGASQENTTYVVFGRKGIGSSGTLNLATLQWPNGYRILPGSYEYRPQSIAGVGDVNDDGFDDLAIGDQYAGEHAPTWQVATETIRTAVADIDQDGVSFRPVTIISAGWRCCTTPSTPTRRCWPLWGTDRDRKTLCWRRWSVWLATSRTAPLVGLERSQRTSARKRSTPMALLTGAPAGYQTGVGSMSTFWQLAPMQLLGIPHSASISTFAIARMSCFPVWRPMIVATTAR